MEKITGRAASASRRTDRKSPVEEVAGKETMEKCQKTAAVVAGVPGKWYDTPIRVCIFKGDQREREGIICERLRAGGVPDTGAGTLFSGEAFGRGSRRAASG